MRVVISGNKWVLRVLGAAMTAIPIFLFVVAVVGLHPTLLFMKFAAIVCTGIFVMVLGVLIFTSTL